MIDTFTDDELMGLVEEGEFMGLVDDSEFMGAVDDFGDVELMGRRRRRRRKRGGRIRGLFRRLRTRRGRRKALKRYGRFTAQRFLPLSVRIGLAIRRRIKRRRRRRRR